MISGMGRCGLALFILYVTVGSCPPPGPDGDHHPQTPESTATKLLFQHLRSLLNIGEGRKISLHRKDGLKLNDRKKTP
jgi:hypothetical protein